MFVCVFSSLNDCMTVLRLAFDIQQRSSNELIHY